ncbi:extracellular solute-binding protein [Paenibacillus lignilyticus]|uniref:Extracellular solute-binding protein n=1 Tax=Paenibacillus lignilyticus TaxID=1172615 RepID=A0ABS5CCQ2_9BACL|nr:extracellular solute-binding protein [Paenibacillus lignilyticus]MBP3961557.1 extracellular solute-binding protein [Paenibacillus lignilyticus]MBP3963773.1 extracellular solute-binding protein [Paenibacillus lignilyticus]
MRNKLVSSVLVVALSGSILAACSSGNEDTNSNTSSNAGTTNNGAATTADPHAEKLTIDWFDGTWEDPVPTGNSEAVHKINEKFNVDFKPQYIPFDTYEEKLAVKMASGDIPDVIGMEEVNANYTKWAKQGAFLPLDEFLKQYESTKAVPDYSWDSLKVGGKVYGIPTYFSSKGGKKPIIRKDWLDKLGLKMPTNYEELKKVAIAFTKDDPDGNGKADTIGLGLAKGIYYDPSFGAYYGNAVWYHKNSSGQLIPGIIADGNKEKVTFLADLQKEGILQADWAVTAYKDIFKAFNAGKVGIWYEQPGNSGNNGVLFDVLKQNAPNAVVEPIPPFKAPDGSEGLTINGSWYRMYMISAKLKDQPEKVKRILEMIDYFHKPVTFEERNPQNEYFDWLYGGEGKGYQMVDGVAQPIAENRSNVAPGAYITEGGWFMNDEDLFTFAKIAKTPEDQKFQQTLADRLHSMKFYVNPTSRIISPLLMEKSGELQTYITDETTKMIFGERPLSDWDKMVEEYMAKGGKEMIDEVNKELEANHVQGEWK